MISTRKLPKLGTVLVNSKGRTFYMFVPDKRKKVTCVKSDAVIWPPLKLPKGAKPVASGKAKASPLGSDPNPAGGRVVTYNKWPLYTYITDSAPGPSQRPSAQPQRRPLVRPLPLRQGDQDQALINADDVITRTTLRGGSAAYIGDGRHKLPIKRRYGTRSGRKRATQRRSASTSGSRPPKTATG